MRIHGVSDVAGRRVVQREQSSGLPLGGEPNQVLQQDGGYGVWLGGVMWSAPRDELEAAPQAIPAIGGGSSGVRPTGRARGHAHGQAILVWGARSCVHVVSILISEVPANRGGGESA